MRDFTKSPKSPRTSVLDVLAPSSRYVLDTLFCSRTNAPFKKQIQRFITVCTTVPQNACPKGARIARTPVWRRPNLERHPHSSCVHHDYFYFMPILTAGFGTGQLKCDGTRAETRIRLSTKRTNPFKSAGASV